jgi:hypothetical protein
MIEHYKQYLTLILEAQRYAVAQDIHDFGIQTMIFEMEEEIRRTELRDFWMKVK